MATQSSQASTPTSISATHRVRWVIGNWKMNPTLQAAKNLAHSIAEKANQDQSIQHCRVALAPTTLHLISVGAQLGAHQNITLVAQDVASTGPTGAYTGDISADLLKDAGATWTLVGHSERRTLHHEDEIILGAKFKAALIAGLGVIWCVGETLAEREAGSAIDVVTAQIQAHADILASIAPEQLIVAYEPVWAIGTGKTASPEDAQQMHAALRQVLANIRADLILTSLLYGGSVKSDNARLLAQCPDIDGALVGGASLDADSFLQIAQAFDVA